MSQGIVRRLSLDPKLLWLWHRPAAIAPIRPLAWEPPYAMDAGFKKQQQQQKVHKDLYELVFVSGLLPPFLIYSKT